MNTLKIDIVSDVVCPWCVIGFRNLKKAIKELENELSFKISWRPYELHPEIPSNGYDKELYMQQKFGPTRGKGAYDEIIKIGKDLNFDFNFSKSERIPNTFFAHRLLWYSEQKSLQNELSEALFYAYFTEGQDVGSIKILVNIAAEIGLDALQVRTFLESKSGTNEVEDQERESLEKSIGAVPTYIINNQYLIQGGQQPETFVAFLRKIQNKEIEKQNVQ
ncbi:MAG TPA: DsbA family oxidoreductase [Gammaproteobacteria bacterium]|jgi:predicted DsbA family dithiol-disulfide isomerase|nr:DsbA family oxidoreductase [Gammaproteobacteria bacterium]HIK72094.1 DsbA family oxidoreductase [Gammaproteobacteria bacterium]